MSAFDLDFSLYSLLLGLALVQVLSGLVQTVQSPDRVKMGWLTPLLGLFVILDLTSFWTIAWSVRDAAPPGFLALLYGLAVMGLYYFAASLVFPTRPEDYANLDQHFFRYRRIVIGAVIGCNLLAWTGQALIGVNPVPRVQDAAAITVWLVSLLALMLLRKPKPLLVLLIFVIAIYPVSGALSLAGL
ncbi:hypothetical protein [Sphingomonas sp.]|uniref:hypothetical protein n=1 Tax=Sphingomonas sp. TaxID=28214 RepID=UPI0025EA127F|nr:hypothetical protein [Sphingomonas sp.]